MAPPRRHLSFRRVADSGRGTNAHYFFSSGDLGVRAAGSSYRYCYVSLALIRSLP